MAAAVVLSEAELELWFGLFPLLRSWVGRSVFQLFVGLFTLTLATSEGDTDFAKSVMLYRRIAGYWLLLCALLYFVGGVSERLNERVHLSGAARPTLGNPFPPCSCSVSTI